MSGFKSEIIYDHYKETFQQQVKYLSQRNKYFILLLGLGAVLFFQLTNLTSINNLIEGLIQSHDRHRFIITQSFPRLKPPQVFEHSSCVPGVPRWQIATTLKALNDFRGTIIGMENMT